MCASDGRNHRPVAGAKHAQLTNSARQPECSGRRPGRFKAIRRRVSARRTAQRRFLRLVGPGRDRRRSADIDVLRTNDLRPIVTHRWLLSRSAGRRTIADSDAPPSPTTTTTNVSPAGRSLLSTPRTTLALVPPCSLLLLPLLQFSTILIVGSRPHTPFHSLAFALSHSISSASARAVFTFALS